MPASQRAASRLTHPLIVALKAPEDGREYFRFDTSWRGDGKLAIRVRRGADGAAVKHFVFLYRLRGASVRRKMVLGAFGDRTRSAGLSLETAREHARQLNQQVRNGIDPLDARTAQAKAAEQARREARSKGTFAQLVEAYVAQLRARGARSADNVNETLERDALPVIGPGTLAREVTFADVRSVLQRVARRGALAQANKVRGHLSAAFNAGLRHEKRVVAGDAPDVSFGLTHNPARDVPPVERPGATGVRDVELSADLLRRFWQEIDEPFVPLPTRRSASERNRYKTKRKPQPSTCRPTILDASMRAAYRLLIVTGGQRVEMLLGARWSEFDLDRRIWTIPHERRKNRLHSRGPHVVPLNAIAVDVLTTHKASFAPEPQPGDYLFPIPRRSKRAPHLHPHTLRQALTRWIKATKFPLAFAPRDFRQTFMSRAGELGLSKEIRDRIQDRPPTDVGAKHYDGYSYLDEKRTALDRWDARLREIVAGHSVTSNVVPFPTAAAK